jgi:hypothetical protein
MRRRVEKAGRDTKLAVLVAILRAEASEVSGQLA